MIEYRDTLDISKLSQAGPLALDSSDLGATTLTETSSILPLTKNKGKTRVQKASQAQIEEADRVRQLGFIELETEIIAAMGEDTRVSHQREVELSNVGSMSMSSENFRALNESVAHSNGQDFNRAKFSKADGDILKKEYEDFFSEPIIPVKVPIAAQPG